MANIRQRGDSEVFIELAAAAVRDACKSFNRAIAKKDHEAIAGILADNVILVTGTDSDLINRRNAQVESWPGDFKDDAWLVHVRTPDCFSLSPLDPVALETGTWRGAPEKGGDDHVGGYFRRVLAAAVTLVQRFASALNLNVHFQLLYLVRCDGSAKARRTDRGAQRDGCAEAAGAILRTGQAAAGIPGARRLARISVAGWPSGGGCGLPDLPVKTRGRQVRADPEVHDANRLRQGRRFESTIRRRAMVRFGTLKKFKAE